MTMHTAEPGSLESLCKHVPAPEDVTAVPHPPGLPNEAPWLESSFGETRRLRHDGWDGPKAAAFCARLA